MEGRKLQREMSIWSNVWQLSVDAGKISIHGNRMDNQVSDLVRWTLVEPMTGAVRH
jgi:hypothetical protein